jgi:hypothetical protein
MIEPQAHVVAIFILAAIVVFATYAAGGRLRVAGTVLFMSFSTVLYGQLVLGLVAPSLTVLTAACDMVTLGVIGWVLMKAKRRTGLHVAGFAMCVSLMSHVAYHIAGIGEGATLAYFLVTNSAMVVACLGLLCTALSQLVGRHGMGFGLHSHNGSGLSGAGRVAARYKGRP